MTISCITHATKAFTALNHFGQPVLVEEGTPIHFLKENKDGVVFFWIQADFGVDQLAVLTPRYNGAFGNQFNN